MRSGYDLREADNHLCITEHEHEIAVIVASLRRVRWRQPIRSGDP